MAEVHVEKSSNPIEKLVDSISEDLSGCRPLVEFSKKIGVKPGMVVLVSGGILALFTLLGLCSDLIVLFIGFLYPAYCSFKALETDAQKDDKQWLMYWVVFVCLSVADDLFGVFMTIIPMYHFTKLILYVWLFYPKSKGALTLYYKLFRPVLQRVVPMIEAQVEDLKNKHPTLKAAAEKLE
mmetsp:Transcript_72941/g.84624  ORF Transcript_72941/g.84624 Transcript_72941/m.84624 type:complete len:181 (+) Transcript_72941:25-567(+)|eukprot:CAMPEP_0176462842 /NCGR_PEP_ID=MMETSP0127-20121128/35516_1 /TAXON_ID=938130 /ORGANISM="Platyophrya macrostoma, Strain WH" /LENGTH=180 /DNA_ID=CAMNT_0017854853 /DNA_START=99 /DNA_END=641 /DNA_ORIENTATION=+